MYIYWMETDFKTCPMTKENAWGDSASRVGVGPKEFNGKVIKDMPRDGVDTKILPHMIGYCGMGGVPKDGESGAMEQEPDVRVISFLTTHKDEGQGISPPPSTNLRRAAGGDA